MYTSPPACAPVKACVWPKARASGTHSSLRPGLLFSLLLEQLENPGGFLPAGLGGHLQEIQAVGHVVPGFGAAVPSHFLVAHHIALFQRTDRAAGAGVD